MSSSERDLEHDIDRLYALPGDEFTAARNDLVKRLRKEGDRDSAERIKALRRPSLTAWAVNQVVHHRPEVYDALVQATLQIRAAHEKGPEGLDAALADRKVALAAATQVAEVMLIGDGSRPGPAQMRRVTQTLDALSMEPGETVVGRLTEELEPPGFAALAGLAFGGIPAGPRKPAAPSVTGSVASSTPLEGSASSTVEAAGGHPAAGPVPPALLEAKARIEELEAEAAEAEAERLRVDRDYRDAEQAHTAAQKDVTLSQRALAAAESAMAAAEAALAEATSELTTAENVHTEARRGLEAAQQALSALAREREAAERSHEEIVAALGKAHRHIEEMS